MNDLLMLLFSKKIQLLREPKWTFDHFEHSNPDSFAKSKPRLMNRKSATVLSLQNMGNYDRLQP